jgi:hypothetical protein
MLLLIIIRFMKDERPWDVGSESESETETGTGTGTGRWSRSGYGI